MDGLLQSLLSAWLVWRIAVLLLLVLKPRYEEDSIDRLNYRYTSWILLACAILLSSYQYVGQPLQCWVPAQFKGGWSQYTADYCFVENTYWLPYERQIPEKHADRDELMLNYYQWVPYMLALQALMFNLPHILWRMLNWVSGLQVRAIIFMSSQNDNLDIVAGHIREGVGIEKAVSRNSNPAGWIFRLLFLSQGVFVTSMYLIMKLLNFGVIIGQFYLLAAFLGPKYHFWGLEIFKDLIDGRHWFQTGHFPRVTLCDLEVRDLGNIHRWTVQCVLMINMFNEKVYLFLWWWFLVLAVATAFNLFKWLSMTLLPSTNRKFITRLLNARAIALGPGSEAQIERFTSNVLKTDGTTVMRLVAENAGDMIASEICVHLWQHWLHEQEKANTEQPAYNSSYPPSYSNINTLQPKQTDM